MKLGFIGMGNMASALARGFLASGKVNAADLCAFDPAAEKLAAMAAELGFTALDSEIGSQQNLPDGAASLRAGPDGLLLPLMPKTVHSRRFYTD